MLRHVLLSALTCATVWPVVSSAQIPRRLESCLPIPTLAQDIEQRREQAHGERPDREFAKPQIKIKRLTFRGNPALALSVQAQISASVRKQVGGDEDYDWLGELQERVRDAWQHRGYFRVEVEQPQARQLIETPLGKSLAVSVLVDAGRRYRLKNIEIRRGTQFALDELRPLFPITDGDVFDTHKIQQGIENLRKAYAMKAFINFSAVPSTDIDETHGLITLLIEVEEGTQFHIGRVEVLGLDPVIAQKLLHESGLDPGNIFDPSLLDKFFERNKLILPRDAKPEEDTKRLLDEYHATVDLTMDFRGCPQIIEP